MILEMYKKSIDMILRESVTRVFYFLMMGSQSEILFHEILDVQKIIIGWTTFFFLALKFGRNS